MCSNKLWQHGSKPVWPKQSRDEQFIIYVSAFFLPHFKVFLTYVRKEALFSSTLSYKERWLSQFAVLEPDWSGLGFNSNQSSGRNWSPDCESVPRQPPQRGLHWWLSLMWSYGNTGAVSLNVRSVQHCTTLHHLHHHKWLLIQGSSKQ